MKRKIALAAVVLAWAGALRAAEHRLTDRVALAGEISPLAQAPPGEAASTFVLGGFKAVLLDYLWVKADLCHREGRLHELLPVLEFIETLQPRNAAVREYTAWHMAYNVSLWEAEPDRSWSWVRRALRRLEAAVGMHPENPSLRILLGRIFLEKCDAESSALRGRAVREEWGREAADLAREHFEAAVSLPGHRTAADVFLAVTLIRQLPDDPAAAERLGELLRHVRSHHPKMYDDFRRMTAEVFTEKE
jgi:hypothetical protein